MGVLTTVAAAEYARSLAESDLNNARALRRLRDEGKVKIAKFDVSVLNTVHALSSEVVAEIGSRDELSKKIYASYLQFRNLIADWGEISGRYLIGRSPA
jgi:TRAP-type mannitol/chloroaromatic compound transport system substrate-binding protein